MKGLKISYKKQEPSTKEDEGSKIDDELKYIPKHKNEEQVKAFFNSSKAYDFTKKNQDNESKLESLDDYKNFSINIWTRFMKGDTIKSRQLNNTFIGKLSDIMEYSKKNDTNNQMLNAKDTQHRCYDAEIPTEVTHTGMYLDSKLPGDDEEEEEIVNNFMGYAKLDQEDKIKLAELKELTLKAKQEKGGISSEGEKFLKGTKYMSNKDELYDMEYDQMGLPEKKIKKD